MIKMVKRFELLKGDEIMAFDYSKLRGRIVEKFETQAKFAVAMELSERTITCKLRNKIPWKQGEILKAINLLGLDETDIQEYFFKLKVQNF